MEPAKRSRSREQGVTLKTHVPGLTHGSLKEFAGRAARRAGLKIPPHILVTTTDELQSLNRRFRGKNKATDVLSFPPMREVGESAAGDIAICGEIAATNAQKLGHSTVDEVKILALHGILHLAGYDHESDEGEMESREQELRKALRLPMGLIERSSSRRGRTPRDVGLRRKRG
jgi:probable rRNA maturation factor